MENKKSKSAKTKSAEKDIKTAILEGYMDIWLEHGQQPTSIFKFTKSLGITEKEFYAHFNSFEGIEKHIWHTFFEVTKQRIESDAVYEGFSVREKLLSFYFTFFEELLKNRSYVLACFGKLSPRDLEPKFIKVFKNDFSHYAKELIQEGIETDEIVQRVYISDRYDKGLWVQMMFLLRFWINDDSVGFEKTDAAIEKSVNLSFDLMAKGALDSILDFAKFIVQNRKK